jgi:hypothetical protein
MSSEILIGILGGVIGGLLGVVGTLVSSYYGPRKIEEWREQRNEERLNGPRKSLLKKLLEDPKYKEGRTLETLSRVTGTTDVECRRLLIEIKARGIKLENNKEGWALIERNPIKEQ